MDMSRVVRKGFQLLGGQHVPETDRARFAGRSQNPAVGRECKRAENPGFIAKQATRGAGDRVPECNETILIRSGERAAIRGKLDRGEFLWTREGAQELAVAWVPQAARSRHWNRRRPVLHRAQIPDAGPCRHDP